MKIAHDVTWCFPSIAAAPSRRTDFEELENHIWSLWQICLRSLAIIARRAWVVRLVIPIKCRTEKPEDSDKRNELWSGQLLVTQAFRSWLVCSVFLALKVLYHLFFVQPFWYFWSFVAKTWALENEKKIFIFSQCNETGRTRWHCQAGPVCTARRTAP